MSKYKKKGLKISALEQLNKIRAKDNPNKLESLIALDYDALLELMRGENQAQLESIVSYMRKQANQRRRSLLADEFGKSSPALYNFDEKTGERTLKPAFTSKSYKTVVRDKHLKVTSVNIDHNALVHEYSKLKSFLLARSSTKKGYRELREEMAQRIGSEKLFRSEFKTERSKNLWIKRENLFWKMYHELVGESGGVINMISSDQAQRILNKVMNKYNYQLNKEDQVMKAMRAYIDAAGTDMTKENGVGIKRIEEEFIASFDDEEGFDVGLDKFVSKYSPAKKYDK